MTHFFEFEADFVESLRCIPMQVRLKLDTCGIKLKLNQWNQFSEKERLALVERPCNTEETIQEYREFLRQLVQQHTGESATDLPVEEAPLWLDEQNIPNSVTSKAQEFGIEMTPNQWSNLLPVQRFALIKLSRSSHENKNFLPALKEFHVV
ncbi:nitrate reductase associated protein [Scytonema hofmannii PCC 7110]|uniref:Nitrate reductase associated protein n=1 Tax=Scytonema hofmannii PCC 7110 TaxID=128403 RepID=A0A139XDR9_9CYAN|nr:nitrate reductase associated protein [Scytonema hofmannii]KYC42844.1 nitrate reductase associated protein [Scytonema hofmannii PCC 7110]